MHIGTLIIIGGTLLALLPASRAGIIVEAFPLPDADARIWQVQQHGPMRFTNGWYALDVALAPSRFSKPARILLIRAQAQRGLTGLVPWFWVNRDSSLLRLSDRLLLAWLLEEEKIAPLDPGPPRITNRMLLPPQRTRIPQAPSGWAAPAAPSTED